MFPIYQNVPNIYVQKIIEVRLVVISQQPLGHRTNIIPNENKYLAKFGA